MKGYKAFDRGMVCRGKQYAENTVFKEDRTEICERGMHFCKNPIDVLDHYSLIDKDGYFFDVAEVEALDDCKTDDNKKFCTKELKILKKLSLSEFIRSITSIARDDALSQSGGDRSALVGGDGSKLAGGDGSKLVGGNYSTLAGGDGSKLVGGNYSTLTGGDYSKLAGGNHSKLVGGNGSIMVSGWDSLAKGKRGSLIVLLQRGWVDDKYTITDFCAKIVDGEEIKEDTFYRLENGELVEVVEVEE